MPQPDLRDVHVDTLLTSISIGYKNPGYVATQVFPSVIVEKESDLIPKYVQDFWFRDVAKPLAPGDKAPRSGFTLDTTGRYVVQEVGIAKEIPDRIRDNTDAPFNLDRDASQWVAEMIQLNIEIDFATNFFKTSVWGTDSTPTNLWDDYALSDPIQDIRTQKRTIRGKIGKPANMLVIGEKVMDILTDHPLFVERVKYQGRDVTEEMLAKLLRIDKIIVAQSMQATNKEGAALVLADLFDNDGLLLYSPPSAGMFQPAAGYCFMQRQYAGGDRTVIRRIRDDERKVDIIEGRTAYQLKTIDTRAGCFFSNVTA